MCTSSAPKVQQPTVKPPIYMSNPYLDGLGIGAEASGRNSLRIDMGSPVPTAPPPFIGGGGGSGGGGSGGGGLGIGGGGLGIGSGINRSRGGRGGLVNP